MKKVGENIFDSLEEYITHIQYHILVEEPDDTEVLKFHGKHFMNFKIKVGNARNTIKYILISQLITIYYQEKII